MLAEKLFSMTDKLSRALQAKKVFAIEAKKYIADGLKKDFRSDSKFDDFWSGLKEKAEKLDVDEPVLPRRL